MAQRLRSELCRKGVLGIAYETVEGSDGAFPLLKPMSQIAGRLSIQIGAYLERPMPIYHPMTLLDMSIRGERP